MSNAVLADAVRSATGCTVAQAKEAVDELKAAILKSLKKSGKFAVVGFGTFAVTKRAKRQGRNPFTGEAITIKASKSVRFKPAKAVKAGL
jgi:DNA-binding protein HU-beta